MKRAKRENIYMNLKIINNFFYFDKLFYFIPLIIIIIQATFVFNKGLQPYPNPKFPTDDPYKYVAMAKNPFSDDALARFPPFSWRILTPWIIHFSNLPTLTGFYIVTLSSLAGTCIALIWFLRGLGLNRYYAVSGTIAFLLLPAATWVPLWAYISTEPLSFFLLLMVMGSSVHKKPVMMLIFSLLLALSKEIVIFAVIFSIILSMECKNKRLLIWSIFSLFGTIIILISLRIFIPGHYNFIGYIKSNYLPLSLNVIFLRLSLATFGTWLFLLPLALLQYFHPPFMLKRISFVIFIILCTSQIMVSSNIDRVVIYGFPVVVASATYEIKYLCNKFKLPNKLFWAILWILGASFWIIYDYIARLLLEVSTCPITKFILSGCVKT